MSGDNISTFFNCICDIATQNQRYCFSISVSLVHVFLKVICV